MNSTLTGTYEWELIRTPCNGKQCYRSHYRSGNDDSRPMINTIILHLVLMMPILAPVSWAGGGDLYPRTDNSNSNNLKSNNEQIDDSTFMLSGSITSGNGNSGNVNLIGSSSFSESAQQKLTSRVVHTKYGAVSGVILQLDGRNLDPVEVYKGIPYASPPVGSLRFMPPVTGALWSGVKKADRFGPVCPQRLPDISVASVALEKMPKGRLEYLRRLLPFLQNQSEDCLYLNIYVPTQVRARDGGIGSAQPTKYPVMVFVHGESYEWNSGNPYDGSVLASYGQILVVTINYRLGILGFLNANTDRYSKSPANYGLMDIIAALHWLQENIGAFGGDAQSVTLAGHGTGAACVHFLITSNAVPEGLLFHRAILMSGSGLSPWSLVGEPARYAAIVSHHVNCSPDLPHVHLLKCLRERPLEAILSTPVRPPEFGTAFGPSVDGVVIDTDEKMPPDSGHYEYGAPVPKASTHPIPNTLSTINAVLLRKTALNKLSRYDMLVGVTRAEAYFAFNSEDVQYGIEADRRSKILRTYVRNTYSYHLNEILATIVNEYTDWERPIQHPINIRDETLEALSDAEVVAPAAQTVDLHSADHRNSFLYVFDYQTKYGDFPQRQGCIHGEDLPYLFGAPLVGGFNHFPRNYTKSEISLSETVMAYWSNFVRRGNPNELLESSDRDSGNGGRQERSRFKNVEWTAYESVHKKYLNLDTKSKLKNHYRAHRLSFWLNLVPDLHKPGTDDVPASHHQLENDGSDRASETTVKPLNPPQSKEPLLPSSGNNNTYTILTTQMFSLLNLTSHRSNTASNKSNQQLRVPNSGEVDDDGQSALSGSSGGQEDGFAAYSTALSVTIAIGCSLLILNVLIFAGVYYQRDKTREPRGLVSGSGGGGNLSGPGGCGMGTMKKRNENGQMPNNICGDLEGLTIHSKTDPATILSHHHALHQMPPPEFADMPHRAPPPPKHIKSLPPDVSGQMLPPHALQIIGTGGGGLIGGSGAGNCGTLQKKSCVKNSNNLMVPGGGVVSNCQNQMDELRV